MTHQQRLTQAMAVVMTEARSELDGCTGLSPVSVQAEGSSRRERNDIGSGPQSGSNSTTTAENWRYFCQLAASDR